MAKNSILDWSTTAASNTDIGGININEGCPAANINNAIRETMAQVKSGVDYKVVPVTKGAGYTALTTDNNAIIRFSAAATLSLTAAATLAANWHVTVVADGGAVVIDPNGSETINGATTITIPDGYSAVVWCTGSAFLATKDYVQATPFVTVASAATIDLGAQTSRAISITGTTGITSFGTTAPDGAEYLLKFTGALTVTVGANIVGPEGANIATFNGMTMRVKKEPSNVWRVLSYTSRVYVDGGGSSFVTINAAALTATRTLTMPDANVDLGNLTISKTYTSSDLTITAGGATSSVSHGMGKLPKTVLCELVNQTAEAGYSVGQILPIHPGLNNNGATSQGVALNYGSDLWNIRYGSAANTFAALNFSTGAVTNLTNANWKLRITYCA